MIINTKQLPATALSSYTGKLFSPGRSVCFDIETTGFSAASTQVYLIGCISFDGEYFTLIQWLTQTPAEEPQLLEHFFQYIQSCKTLIHFNGEGFDMPYLLRRCRHYGLSYDFTAYQSIDLYKMLAPYKSILKLPNLKQKTLELFLGIRREDPFHGGELISVYYEYIKSGNAALQAQLLLHNHDDLLGMTEILPAYAYYELFHGNIDTTNCRMHTYTSSRGEAKQEAIFSFTFAHALPQAISYRKNICYLSCENTSGSLSVQVYTDELKYFFSNYKDYYYLPEEDMSIHKSVAFCVDKNFRTQATAANCYNRKSGQFLPQYSELITPYFKQSYKDRLTYFEITDAFLHDETQMLLYVKHLLTILR